MLVGTFNTLVNRALGGEGSQYPKPLEASYTDTHILESEAAEISVLDLSTIRIQWLGDLSLFGHFSSIFNNISQKSKNGA